MLVRTPALASWDSFHRIASWRESDHRPAGAVGAGVACEAEAAEIGAPADDGRFVEAMTRAIESGLEKAPIGASREFGTRRPSRADVMISRTDVR